jgi:hypothetical protein
MDYPNSRNWKAQEAQDSFAGGPWTLSVSGEVEVAESSPALVVYERDEEGTRIRLEVSEVSFAGEEAASGDSAMVWRKVGFRKTGLETAAYDNVVVLYQDFVLGSCGVDIVHS